MDGTPTSPADTPGKETNPQPSGNGSGTDEPTEEPKNNLTPLEKITANNEAMEKGLIKGRELEAERIKLEANKQLRGTSGEHVEEKTQDDKDEEAAKAFMKDDE